MTRRADVPLRGAHSGANPTERWRSRSAGSWRCRPTSGFISWGNGCRGAGRRS